MKTKTNLIRLCMLISTIYLTVGIVWGIVVGWNWYDIPIQAGFITIFTFISEAVLNKIDKNSKAVIIKHNESAN